MIIKSYILHTLGLCIVGVILPWTPVFSHGTGESIEKTVDSYLVDIGYSPELLITGTQSRLDFLLFDIETGQEILFSDLWLRIEKNDRLFFAGGIARPEFGSTGVSFTFFEPGDYSIFVRYEDENESLVETTVSLPVEKGEISSASGTYSGKALAVVALLSFLVTTVLIVGVKSVSIWLLSIINNVKLTLAFIQRKVQKKRLVEESPKATFAGIHKAKIVEILFNVAVGVVVAYLTYLATQYVLTNEFTLPNFIDNEEQAGIDTQTLKNSVYITLTEEGYDPKEIEVKKGTVVTFLNETDNPHWPASNLHPSHEIFPEFDPQEPIPKEESWSFEFDRAGSWEFHDHIRAYYTGVIHVVE